MDFVKELRISTMTAISSIDSNINLKKLYDNVEPDINIKYIEYSEFNKGVNTKKQRNTRKPKEKKFFYNQITMHVWVGKIINLKIFNNGKLQMTGIKNNDQGEQTINIFLNKLSNNENKNDILDNLHFKSDGLKIALINSDFDMKFKINRDILNRMIISGGYYSTFEPSIYPGVNAKYYFNKSNPGGICKCKCNCNGKGDGETSCRRITIAIFNSGKIIITGGRTSEQLNTAYEFITKIINDKKEELLIIDRTYNE